MLILLKMNYSDLIPEVIPKNGTYFYDYCGICKCERRHLVIFIHGNPVRHTVKFTSTCWDCFDKMADFNVANEKLHISENHEVYWTKYIWNIAHWNEFVLNSRVHPSNYPPDDPPLPDKDFLK